MNPLIIHELTDLHAVARRIGGDATVESLKRLNPHLIAERVPAGSMLLLPDGVRHGEEKSPATTQMKLLATEMKAALAASLSVSHQGLAERASERKQVADAMRTQAIRRVVEADPELQPRALRLIEQHRDAQAQDKASEKTLKTLEQAALAEIAALLKAWG